MDYKVIEHKDWHEEKGMLPGRVVLLEINKGDWVEYSTHIQYQKDGQLHLVHGHYFVDIEDARKDFSERIL